MTYVKVCKQCGKTFEAKRSHAECCSPVCRARFSQGLKPISINTKSESESAQVAHQAIPDGHVLVPVALYQQFMSMLTNPQPMTFAFQGVGVIQPTPPPSIPKPLELDLGNVIEVKQSAPKPDASIATNFLASLESVDF